MARRSYSGDKRRRQLDKKKKQEQKRQGAHGTSRGEAYTREADPTIHRPGVYATRRRRGPRPRTSGRTGVAGRWSPGIAVGGWSSA